MRTRNAKFADKLQISITKIVESGCASIKPTGAATLAYRSLHIADSAKHKQVYRRRYESRRSSKPKLH